MPISSYQAPDIYVEEVAGGARPIQAVGTSTAGFVGVAPKADAPVNVAVPINNWSQFVNQFIAEGNASTPLSHAVYGWFQNGGGLCYICNIGAGGSLVGTGRNKAGLDILATIDEIAIVVAPGYTDAASYDLVLTHCERLKDRVAVLDAPEVVDDINKLTRVAVPAARGETPPAPEGEEQPAPRGAAARAAAAAATARGDTGEPGLRARQSDGGYGALYFPWIRVRDPLSPTNAIVAVPPSGHMAGIWARSDAARGVHKAPANEVVNMALDVTYRLTRDEQGQLNSAGVNCIRFFSREGIRVWGARTLADGASEWRYLNVRRLFNMIEESIANSTRWIVFEPNDRLLWNQIRRNVGAFLTRVWRDGALMGASPEQAFFVKCDAETNPPDVIDAGQVVTLIGIAPVKPAEFIIFRISQWAGGSEVTTAGGPGGG